MTYELALELHKAGFPEITRVGMELNLHRYRRIDIVDAASEPLLQELLAEVENKNPPREFAPHLVLAKLGKKWVAYFTDIEDDQFWATKNQPSYSTPDEAVARLWLELNKKT